MAGRPGQRPGTNLLMYGLLNQTFRVTIRYNVLFSVLPHKHNAFYSILLP